MDACIFRSQDVLSAGKEIWEEIATQGIGSNCCVGVGVSLVSGCICWDL